MHGGAKGSGAPLGNRNALKTGAHTAEAILERKLLRDLLWRSRDFLRTLD